MYVFDPVDGTVNVRDKGYDWVIAVIKNMLGICITPGKNWLGIVSFVCNRYTLGTGYNFPFPN
jgi:hypothetical protein